MLSAFIDNDINCDIEMQVVDKKNIEKRILYYWSKMYDRGIVEGRNYKDLKKAIAILITNYELDSLKGVEKYATKWNIREDEYSKVILTEVMEIYIIEVPKFEKYKRKTDKELNSWVNFIENPEEVNMEDNKEIGKAKKVLEEISEDEHERYLTELRQKYIMDQVATEEAGYDKGYKAGEHSGIAIGKEQGIEQEKKEILN